LEYWSYALAISGALNYFLAIRGKVSGLWLGLANQVGWIAYALTTHQYGFFVTVVLFGPINIYGLKKHFEKKEDNGQDQ